MMPIQRLLILLSFLTGNGAIAAVAGNPAPSCPVSSFDGGRVLDPAQFKGKVAYVDFWASWCGPCVASFPFMNELHRESKAQGVEIVAVNLDEERENATDFLRRHPAEFTVAADPEGKCPAVYDVKAMPTSYLIDRRGNIRHVHLGFRDGDKAEIRQQVQTLLREP